MKNRLVVKVGYWFRGNGKSSSTFFECLATYWRWEEVTMMEGEKIDIDDSFNTSTQIRVINIADKEGKIYCREMVAKIQPKGSDFGPFTEVVQHDSPILISITEAAKKLEKLGFQKLD